MAISVLNDFMVKMYGNRAALTRFSKRKKTGFRRSSGL